MWRALPVVALVVGACGEDSGRIEPEAAPTGPSAEERLRETLRRRWGIHRLPGPEREAERLAVRHELEGLCAGEASAAVRAEACFRLGELLRASGRVDPAEAAFRASCEADPEGELRVRSMLELGHLDRRAGRASSALAHYFEVLGDDGASRARRDAALYWYGSVQAVHGDPEGARRAWRRLARDGERALDRVRAFDRWARLELALGREEVAARVLEEADVALAAVAEQATQHGVSVRRALDRMVARARLANAESGSPVSDPTSITTTQAAGRARR